MIIKDKLLVECDVKIYVPKDKEAKAFIISGVSFDGLELNNVELDYLNFMHNALVQEYAKEHG